MPATPRSRRRERLPGPSGLPLLGNLLELDRVRLHAVLEGWAREHGDVYRIRVGRRPLTVVSDSGLIRAILEHRPKRFRRHELLERAAESIGLDGVFTAEGERWRELRMLTDRGFDPARLRGYFETIRRVVERLESRWRARTRAGEAVPVMPDLDDYTLDLTSNVVFGHDIDSQRDPRRSDVREQLECILPVFDKRINGIGLVPWSLVRGADERRLEVALVSLGERFLGIIGEARERFSADLDRLLTPSNLMESMVAAALMPDSRASDRAVLANLFSVFFAGEGAVGGTLGWTLCYLADHPEVMRRLQREADALAETPSFDEVRGLRYAEAVLHESMRLKPIAPIVSVQPTAPVEIGGHAFAAGEVILLLTRMDAVDETYFGDALTFEPGRWLDAGEGGRRHREQASLPFGSGPRACPGRQLAMLEMQCLLATLVRAFDLERLDGASPPAERYAFLMAPEPFTLALRERRPGTSVTPPRRTARAGGDPVNG